MSNTFVVDKQMVKLTLLKIFTFRLKIQMQSSLIIESFSKKRQNYKKGMLM